MRVLIYDLSIKSLRSNSNIANIYLDHLWSHSHTLNVWLTVYVVYLHVLTSYPPPSMTPVLLHLPPPSPWHMYLPVVGGPCPPVGQRPAVLQTESWLGLLTYLGSLPVYITWVIVTWDNYTQLSSLTGVLRCHCLPILQMSTPSGKWWPQLCQNHLLMLNEDI